MAPNRIFAFLISFALGFVISTYGTFATAQSTKRVNPLTYNSWDLTLLSIATGFDLEEVEISTSYHNHWTGYKPVPLGYDQFDRKRDLQKTYDYIKERIVELKGEGDLSTISFEMKRIPIVWAKYNFETQKIIFGILTELSYDREHTQFGTQSSRMKLLIDYPQSIFQRARLFTGCGPDIRSILPPHINSEGRCFAFYVGDEDVAESVKNIADRDGLLMDIICEPSRFYLSPANRRLGGIECKANEVRIYPKNDLSIKPFGVTRLSESSRESYVGKWHHETGVIMEIYNTNKLKFSKNDEVISRSAWAIAPGGHYLTFSNGILILDDERLKLIHAKSGDEYVYSRGDRF